MRLPRDRRLATILLGGALLALSCGDDGGGKPPPRRGVAADPAAAQQPANAAPGTPGGPAAKGKPLDLYDKIPEDFRRELTRSDFTSDPTGDINRDPFRSYLLDTAPGPRTPGGSGDASADDCDRRMVAGAFGLRELKLIGIVLRGTKSYAMFTDSGQLGHIAHRGDCLSKEKARIKNIASDRVMIEIRGEAPPNLPAPPPHEEVWRLHPDELEAGDELLSGTGAP